MLALLGQRFAERIRLDKLYADCAPLGLKLFYDEVTKCQQRPWDIHEVSRVQNNAFSK
jgi:hypothetical protein